MADALFDNQVWIYLNSSDPREIAKTSIRAGDWDVLLRRGFGAKQLREKLLVRSRSESLMLEVGRSGVSKVVIGRRIANSVQSISERHSKMGLYGFDVHIKKEVMNDKKSRDSVRETIVALFKFFSGSYGASAGLHANVFFVALSERFDEISPLVCTSLARFLSRRSEVVKQPVDSISMKRLSVQADLYDTLLRIQNLTFKQCYFEPPGQPMDGTRTSRTTSVYLYTEDPTRYPTYAARFLSGAVNLNQLSIECGLLCDEVFDVVGGQNRFGELKSLEVITYDRSIELRPRIAVFFFSCVLSAAPKLCWFEFRNENVDELYCYSDWGLHYREQLEHIISRHFYLTHVAFMPDVFFFARGTPNLHRNRRLQWTIKICCEIASEGNGGSKHKLLGPLLERCMDSPTIVYEIVSRCVQQLLPVQTESRP